MSVDNDETTGDESLDYLPEFDALEWELTDNGNSIQLSNLKELGGMEVAELLTYLHDDGFIHHGGMFANERNGYLRLYQPE